MNKAMMLGAARYVRADNALENLEELKRYGRRPFVLHGRKAFEAVGDRLTSVLRRYNFEATWWRNDGFCSRSQRDRAATELNARSADFLLAVGGGKCMDLGKAVAAKAGVPVVTLPTFAATCAAVTPFSVMYDNEGRPDGSLYHDMPVAMCIVDTTLLSRAPRRTLCAGIVDSMAKLPELLCGYDGERLPLGLDTAVLLGRYITNILMPVCRALAGGDSIDLDRVFDTVFALTGTCSGYAAGTKQLALAHAFNGAVRALHPAQANTWLHGETVGVGILMQMRMNGDGAENGMRKILMDLGMPYDMRSLNMSSHGLVEAIAAYMQLTKDDDQQRERIREALQAVC